MEPGLAVADDLPVARIVYGVLADGDDVVAVQIEELQVAGVQAAFRTGRGVDPVVDGGLVYGVAGASASEANSPPVR